MQPPETVPMELPPPGAGNGYPHLQLDNLRMWFMVGSGLFRKPLAVKAVDDVSLALWQGETVAIVGESGSGKTTLGRVVLRLLEPTDGRLLYAGMDITHAWQRDLMWLRRKAGIIPQDPYSSVNPTFSIYRILEEPLAVHHLGDPEERSERIHKALENVKLNPPELFQAKYPHQLSGGQRQRVAVARAMILDPEFIVADEPVSMLDASVRISILRLLRQLQGKFGITFLYITHDLATARHFSDRVGIMYAGKIVETGPVSEVLGEPLHPYTQALIEAIPDPDPENRTRDRPALPGEPPVLTAPPPGCHFHPRCPIARAGLCDVVEPPLRELRPGHLVACHLAS
ncbi:MAG TPA: ABC transporter ATP-binding protein [Thermoplasmata archaeon]|nr:ABC transporter ATP-binding protein [Thermoplasmata archaeon]